MFVAGRDYLVRAFFLDPNAYASLRNGHGQASLTPGVTSLTPEVHEWEAGRLRGHAGQVTTVCVHPLGTWLVSGSEDRTVRIWPLQGHRSKGGGRVHPGGGDPGGGGLFAEPIAFRAESDIPTIERATVVLKGHQGHVSEWGGEWVGG